MLFQPSNIYPSTFSGIGAGTVDVTQDLNVSWQVNGDTPMTAYQIKIYQNDSGSTLMYDSGSVSVSPVFEPHDKYGNATYFTAIISAAALSTAGIVNGYQYGYKMLITQWWGVSDYVEQTSASVFITRSTPTLAINTITTPVASNSLTITANYSQAQGDPISTVEWVFALAGSESTPIRKTGAISTQVLSFDADGLITGNTYSIMCKVVTSTGMEASTGFVQFPVSYSSSSLGINYQLAQLKNSSAVYLSWDDLGSNKLAYPYTDTTKTTNGITFTVNGEGDVVATGTATADAYFTIAQGTLSQLGITAGQKFIVTSGYSGAKIVVTETNSSNVVVSTITGNDPLQYIATSTTNTLKFSIVIPSGSVLSSGQQLKPMIALEDKIVAFNDVSANIEPIQSLNGYSNPWPAGGNVNKCAFPDVDFTLNNVRYYTENGILHMSGTSTGETSSNNSAFYDLSVRLPAGTYYFSRFTYPNAVYLLDSNGNGLVTNNGAFTLNAEETVHVGFYVYNKTFNGDAIPLSITEGSSKPSSYTPTSNICPISGRTGVVVTRTGKNLYSRENGQYNVPVYATDGTSASYPDVNVVYIPVKPNTKYTITPQPNSTQYYVRWIECDGNKGYVWRDSSLTTSTTSPRTYTTRANTEYLQIAANQYNTANINKNDWEICIQEGTDTTYYPYSGNQISTDWTTPAGTVYGGTLDVVTGQLTVDRAMVDLGTLNWSMIGSTNKYFQSDALIGSIKPPVNSSTLANAICEEYKCVTWSDPTYESGRFAVNGDPTPSRGKISFINTNYASAADFKTAMSGIKLVYELATPLTYQLTPTQVSVLTGINNVWSTGDSVSVTYTKDTGSQATLSGAIVTFSDSNAVLIPTPQYIPGITGISIYRYLQGESALQHVYDLATGATSILDYYAPSQMQVSYLIVAHSGIGDLFLQTTKFTPTFWFFSILLCDTDSNGDYHVSKEYIFKYGVETGAVSNNNDPTIQKNFTPYPNRQPISTLYKTGKISGYIGKTNNLNRYSDSISLQNAIYDISVSSLDKFLKSRKGDVIKVDTASSIQMKTEDNTVQQALKATVDWVEVGEASQVSIVSVPSDSFWPIS